MNKKITIAIISILVLALVVGGFWWWQNNKKQSQVSVEQEKQKQEIDHSEESPEKVVEKFYGWYVKEINICTGIKKEHDCNFDFRNGTVEKGFVTKDFYGNVLSDRDGHSNPIICAQDTPDRMSNSYYQAIDLSQDKSATVMVHLIYSMSGDNQIKVKLKLIDNQWKIDGITCLKWEK